jgi:hypothetical protein
VKAVAYYHSANPAPGREYLARFVKHLLLICTEFGPGICIEY